MLKEHSIIDDHQRFVLRTSLHTPTDQKSNNDGLDLDPTFCSDIPGPSNHQLLDVEFEENVDNQQIQHPDLESAINDSDLDHS